MQGPHQDAVKSTITGKVALFALPRSVSKADSEPIVITDPFDMLLSDLENSYDGLYR